MRLKEALTAFLMQRFPSWGRLYLSYSASAKVLSIHCRTPQQRAKILGDTEALSRLDIGIDQIQLLYPDTETIRIVCQTTGQEHWPAP